MKKKPWPKRRCEICHQWFSPHPRAPRQRCCSKSACQKARKKRNKTNWWLRNPDYGKGRNPKIRTWANEYPNYWRKYRKNHPDYIRKERQRRRSAHRRSENAAKQDSVRQIYVEKLESIRDLEPVSAAKQDSVHRRLSDILNCLIWKEFAAKQDGMANCLASVP